MLINPCTIAEQLSDEFKHYVKSEDRAGASMRRLTGDVHGLLPKHKASVLRFVQKCQFLMTTDEWERANKGHYGVLLKKHVETSDEALAFCLIALEEDPMEVPVRARDNIPDVIRIPPYRSMITSFFERTCCSIPDDEIKALPLYLKALSNSFEKH